MRTVRLARIAAEAEGLRLRHRAQRAAGRALLGLVAFFLLLDGLVFGHLAAWFWLRLHWDQLPSALIIAGADLALALLLVLVAARSTPSQVELEALAVRQRAVSSITGTLALSTLTVPLLRAALLLFRRRPRG